MEEFTTRPDLEDMKAVRTIKKEAPGVDKVTYPEECPRGNGTASKGVGHRHHKRRSRRGAELPGKREVREEERPGEGTEDEQKGTSTREGPNTSGEHIGQRGNAPKNSKHYQMRRSMNTWSVPRIDPQQGLSGEDTLHL